MLWEFWQYWRVKAAKHVRKMGYAYETVAMMARAQRCQYTWSPHYQACRQAIQSAMQSCTQQRTVLVMGAGTLQDIPLQELSETFQRVVLIDVVLSAAAQAHVKAYPNVELQLHDVTESLDSLYHGVLQVHEPQAWLDDDEVDLVVSLNLLAQLPILPIRWLVSRYHLDAQQADHLGQRLVMAHLDYLQRFQTTVCLIADRQHFELNAQDEPLDQFEAWWGVVDWPTAYRWRWEVAPLSEDRSGSKRQINEVGVNLYCAKVS